MFRLLVVLCCVLSLKAQLVEEQHPAPEPYSFAFSSPNEDGTSSSREETGDANGRVTGSYTILGADGQQRRVEYVADENGFRANVITNEIGTESQNTADVLFQSSAPTAAELTAQWEASGAGRARLGQAAGPFGGQILAAPKAGPAIRAPFNAFQGGGLIASPIAPIGGGFVGSQALRVNQGLRVAVPKPISRGARLPALVAPAPIPQPIAVPIAPVAAPIPAPIAAGAIHGGGFTRAQSIGQFGAGFAGQPFGVRLVPMGGNAFNLGQFGFGVAPVGVNTAQLQPFGAIRGFQNPYADIRGLNFGNFPAAGSNFGSQAHLAQAHPAQQGFGSPSNVITQKTESDTKEEDYGRKSK